MKGKKWLHNNYLDELSGSLYRPLLTVEHLNPFKIEIKKMTLPNMNSDEEYNFRGWEFVKNSKRYLVSDFDNQDNPVDIKEVLPILPEMPLELGYRGQVYNHIKSPISMRKKKEKHHEFKEMIDMMSQLSSTNQEHQIALNLIGFTSVSSRFNCAMCSNPGFGKDFTVDRHHAIEGNAGSIESPTLAKLEERSSVLKWFMINEVCNMSGSDWRITQGYLLSFGAHKNEVTRHSCGIGRGEIIDARKLSLTLAFNDISEYKNWDKKFFDFATDGNVVDRFPRFRFWGSYTEDFNSLARGDTPKNYARHNLTDFKELMYTYEYFIDKLYYKPEEVLHGWDRTSIGVLLGRDGTNINRLLDVVDMYCESQQEFNKWIKIFELAMKDYRVMTSYPFKIEGLFEKMNIPKTVIEKAMNNFNICINKRQGVHIYDGVVISWMKGKHTTDGKWTSEEWKGNHDYLNAIYNADTFINKDLLIRSYIPPKSRKIKDSDKSVWN